ncbi:MAG: hypothetical protein ISF22_08000 [Methanomassiliicoccus sp.]|nr:hypothetical protein [Methanomassiliicoccus sp.]
MTDVTIRGIDDETYSRFAAEAKKRGVSIGELTTEAMRSLINETSGPSYRIGDVNALVVSRTDLESLDGPVTLTDIDMLEFDESVDWPTFSQHVKSIRDVDLLLLPRGLTKFQILTKSKDVALIQSKDGGSIPRKR